MNESEINLKIAELLGEVIPDKETSPILFRGYTPPDYINDPAQREPLMIELHKTGWRPIFCEDDYWAWREPVDCCHGRIGPISTKIFGLALCEAWIKMMEGKDEQV